jgi:DNA-binding NarL/FixJ family response regulator
MPLHILLVDDSKTFANSVARFIGLIEGAQVVGHACDGVEALEKALEFKPDLILMDIAMPKLTGLQVAQRLQALPAPPVIVFLSMHADAAYQEAAKNAGALKFVNKANFVDELHPLIEKMVMDHRSSNAHGEPRETVLIGEK